MTPCSRGALLCAALIQILLSPAAYAQAYFSDSFTSHMNNWQSRSWDRANQSEIGDRLKQTVLSADGSTLHLRLYDHGA